MTYSCLYSSALAAGLLASASLVQISFAADVIVTSETYTLDSVAYTEISGGTSDDYAKYDGSGNFMVVSGGYILLDSGLTIANAIVGDDAVTTTREYLKIASGSTITNLLVNIDGNLDNAGTVTALTGDHGAIVSNTGTIGTFTATNSIVDNDGRIGTFNVGGSTVTNDGTVDKLIMNEGDDYYGGTIANYGTLSYVELHAGYLINYSTATITEIVVDKTTTGSGIFVNYGTISSSTASASNPTGDYAVTLDAGLVYNYGTTDAVTISGGSLFNLTSKYEAVLVYGTDGLPLEDDNGDYVYTQNEVGTSAGLISYIELNGSTTFDTDNEPTSVDGAIYNLAGGEITTIVMTDGVIYNQSSHKATDGEESSLESLRSSKSSTIGTLTMSGGYLNNSGATAAEGDLIASPASTIGTLNLNGGVAKNYGNITTITMTAGYLESAGIVDTLTVTGGSVSLMQGNSISTFTATGTTSDGSNSITSLTNAYGAYIGTATLTNVTMTNSGTMGLWWDTASTSDNPEHIEGKVILNSGAVLYNYTDTTDTDATAAILLTTTVNSGATLYNTGTIGFYNCGHGETFKATLTINGGTVNNTGTGYIWDVDVISGGSLSSSGSSAYVHELRLADGTVTNSDGAYMYTVEVTGGTFTNSSDISQHSSNLDELDEEADYDYSINSLTVTGGTAINKDGGSIYLAMVETAGTLLNSGTSSTKSTISSLTVLDGGVAYNGYTSTSTTESSSTAFIDVASIYSGGKFYNNASVETLNVGYWVSDDYAGESSDFDGGYAYNATSGSITSLNVISGGKMDNDGTIGNVYSVYAATLNNNQGANITGDVVVMTDGTVNNAGTVEGTVTLTGADWGWADDDDNWVSNIQYATLTNTGSLVDVNANAYSTTTNSGKITGTLNVSGTASKVTNTAGGSINIVNVSAEGVVSNEAADGTTAAGSITTVNITSEGTLNNAGKIGTVTMKGTVDTSTWTASNAQLFNDGSGLIDLLVVNEYGIADNSGEITLATVDGSGGIINNALGASIDDVYVGYSYDFDEAKVSATYWGGEVNNLGEIGNLTAIVGETTNESSGSIDKATVSGTSTLANEGTILILDAYGDTTSLTNSGTIGSLTEEEETGIYELSGGLILNGATLTNSGTISSASLGSYTGNWDNDAGASYTSDSLLINTTDGVIYDVDIAEASVFINDGGTVKYTTDVAGEAYNYGDLNGTTTVAGENAVLYNGGSTENGGTSYSGAGAIANLIVTSGVVYNASGSSITKATVSGGSIVNGEAASTDTSTDTSEEGDGSSDTTTESQTADITDLYVNATGSVTNNASGSIVNAYIGYSEGVDEDGNFTTSAGGSLINLGEITNAYLSDGTLRNNDGGTIDTVAVWGGGGVYNDADSTINSLYVGYQDADHPQYYLGYAENEGTIGAVSAITGTVDNKGTIVGTAYISGTAVLNNYGTVGTTDDSEVYIWGGTVNNYYDGEGVSITTVTLNGNGSYNHYGVSTEGSEELLDDTLAKLNLEWGTFTVATGNLSITEIYNNTVSTDSSTNTTISVEEGASLTLSNENQQYVDVLDNDGTVTTAGDLTVNSNVTGEGNLTVDGTLTINNMKAATEWDSDGNATVSAEVNGSAGSITAKDIQMEAGSLTLTDILTLTETEKSNQASNLATASLSMMQSSTLNVNGNFQADEVIINSDNATGDSMATQTIISTDTLSVSDSGMTFVLTVDSLLQFGLDTAESKDLVYADGSTSWVTLLSITDGYKTSSIENFTLQIVDDDGNVLDTISSGEYYAYGYDGYHFDVVYTDGVVSSVNIYLATVPEPSTSALSLMALAGLLARRKRRQA